MLGPNYPKQSFRLRFELPGVVEEQSNVLHGSVRIPVAVTTLSIQFFNAQNTQVGTSSVAVQLQADVSATINAPFDFDEPATGTAPTTIAYEAGPDGFVPSNVEFLRLTGRTTAGTVVFTHTFELGFSTTAGTVNIPFSVTTLQFR